MFTGTNTTGVFGRMGGSPERQEEMENEASKYAVVEAVLKVYDENARLRIENERLKRLNDDIATIAAPTECESDPYAYAKARIMEEGRKNLVDKAIKYWPDVTVRRDDSGLIFVEKFEKWRKDNVNEVLLQAHGHRDSRRVREGEAQGDGRAGRGRARER